MEKPRTGFLESVFKGFYAEELASPRLPAPDEAKVSGFLERFHEAVAAIPPAGAGAPPSRHAEHAVPPELMAELRKTGMFGLMIPKEYGGQGFTLAEYLSVIEGMSQSDMALALIPLAHLSIGVMGVLLFATEEQKRRYLPGAASGETIFAYALTEPETGSDAQHIKTTARLSADGSHYVLDGTKTYITNANYAGAFSVFAQMDPQKPGHMGMFVVERGWTGVTVGPDMPKMGLGVSSTAPVRLSSVRVPRENLIGQPGDGFKIAMTILNYGRLALGAASVGLMKRSLSDMTKRASSRVQFGVPIREFELIQEKMVHAKVHSFAASAMTSFTAALLQADPVINASMESSHCKLYGTTRCWDTLYDAMQTAGGAGYLSTLPYEKRMRDFRVTTIFEGTTEIHSIYPPLALFRSYGKELQDMGPLGKLSGLGGIQRTRILSRMHDPCPELERALASAARGEGLFRSLLASGLRAYGARVPTREFFLRRMTNISMSVFWLLASVWDIRRRHPDKAYPREELDVLEYLTEEAREVQDRDARVRPDAKEIIHKAIAERL